MRTGSTLRAATAVVVALLAAACTGPTVGGAGRGFVAGEGSQLIPADQREPAPEIDAETLDGGRLALRDLPGPVVVNFWASWCGPCAEEEPELVALAHAYGPRGVSFVGVDVKDSRANAQAFASGFDVPFPSWYDPGATIAAQFGGIGPSALPTTLILDRDHRVAVRLLGAVNRARMRPHLDALLED